MKIAEISAFNNFSVGSIMNQIKVELLNQGHECKVYYFRNQQDSNNYLGSKFNLYYNALLSRLFDVDGFVTKRNTKKLIDELDEFNPDIVHLHCLHGYYLNCKLLFEYLKKKKIKVVWTMHDNWAITGHCAYFDLRKCDKWKSGCGGCPAKKDYPKSLLDFSKRNYIQKKNVFTSLDENQLYIVSPSKWLDKIIEQSFLNKYNHKVIYNSINLSKFKNYDNPREKVLLAVASVWDERKNLSKVLEISSNLNEWKVIVVGKIDKKINKEKYVNVKFIDRTNSIDELINIYNRASILINPTLADNYPTVNLEAQMCGLKVMTYNTGGAIETDLGNLFVFDEQTFVNDVYLDNLFNKVEMIVNDDKIMFDAMSQLYINLFNEILG